MINDVTMMSFLCFHERKGLKAKNFIMTSNCKFMLIFVFSGRNLVSIPSVCVCVCVYVCVCVCVCVCVISLCLYQACRLHLCWIATTVISCYALKCNKLPAVILKFWTPLEGTAARDLPHP